LVKKNPLPFIGREIAVCCCTCGVCCGACGVACGVASIVGSNRLETVQLPV